MRIRHRNGGGHHLVGLALGERHAALVGLLTILVGDVLGRVVGEIVGEDAVAHGGRDGAVTDAVDNNIGGCRRSPR